jgi:catechol 2,3-dioxygenase
MIAWYGTVVGTTVTHCFEGGAWLTNDDANHRIALLTVPGLVDDPDKIAHTGLHHSAYEYGSMDGLFDTYVRLKAEGIVPHMCLDHGMTMSCYYVDPGRAQRRAAVRRVRRLVEVQGLHAPRTRVRGRPDRDAGRP